MWGGTPLLASCCGLCGPLGTAAGYTFGQAQAPVRAMQAIRHHARREPYERAGQARRGVPGEAGSSGIQ